MGVKWLLRWTSKSGRPAPGDLEVLQVALDALNTKKDKEGTVLIDQFQYFRQQLAHGQDRRNTGGCSDICVIRFAEVPDGGFMLSIKQSPVKLKHVVEATTAMLSILDSFLEYKLAAMLKFEGKKYRLGDFAIKLATVTQSGSSAPSFLGHILEVEYTPLMHMDEATAVLSDFVELLSAALPQDSGTLQVFPIQLEQCQKLPDVYAPQHTAAQYADVAFSMLRQQK